MKRKISTGILAILFAFILLPTITVSAKESKNETSIEGITTDLGSMLKKVEYDRLRELLDFAKEQLQEGNLETEEGIDQAISEGEERFDVTLSGKDKEKIHTLAEKIKGLKIKPEILLEQAEKIYEKYGKELTDKAKENSQQIIEETKDTIKEEVKTSMKDYFSQMVGRVREFFLNVKGR